MFRIVDVAVFTRGVFMENWFFRKLIALWEVWEGFSLPEHFECDDENRTAITWKFNFSSFICFYTPTGL